MQSDDDSATIHNPTTPPTTTAQPAIEATVFAPVSPAAVQMAGPMPPQGYSQPQGSAPQQWHPQPHGYAPQGGYPQQGYPQQGYPQQAGYPPPQGYPPPGYSPPQGGYPYPHGYPPQGNYPYPQGYMQTQAAPQKSGCVSAFFVIIAVLAGGTGLFIKLMEGSDAGSKELMPYMAVMVIAAFLAALTR